MSKCPDCGTELTDMVYGYEDCGPHAIEDFVAQPGYVIPVESGFADWDRYDKLCITADQLPEQTTVWVTMDKCCARWSEPDAEETDWCPKCRDVMEPAK